MRILAIETSGRTASVAAIEATGAEFVVMREAGTTRDERTAQALFPVLEGMLQEVGWAPDTIELVAVAVGPGSFTGLRIGVTLAKTFAYAVGAEVIGVNTLAVLAEQAPRQATPFWTIMDAQRQELFAAKFVGAGKQRPMVGETQIMSQADWLAGLTAGDFATGPALRKLAAQLPAGIATVEESCWEPTASAVGQVAWLEYSGGRRDDVWKLAPEYYRLSAAEEKKAQR